MTMRHYDSTIEDEEPSDKKLSRSQVWTILGVWALFLIAVVAAVFIMFNRPAHASTEPFAGITDGWKPGIDRPARSTWTPAGAGLWVHGVCGLGFSLPRAFYFQGTHTNDGLDALLYLPMALGRWLTWTGYSLGDVAQGSVAQFLDGGQGWPGYRPLARGCVPNAG